MLRKFLVILLVLLTGLVVLAQDEEAEGLQIPLMLDGDVVEDFLSFDIQTRLYAFNGNEDDAVSLTMNAGETGQLDPLLLVFGPEGELVGLNDDSDGLNSALSIELPETGTYFVFASSFQFITTMMIDENSVPQGELDFTLSITGNTEVEGMEESLIYVAGVLEAGEAFEAELSEEQSAAYFIFEGEEGDVLSLLAESEEFDTVLHVFSSEGERIAVNDDIAFPDNINSEIVELELPSDGTYLVIVGETWTMQGRPESATLSNFGEFTIELNLE